MINCAGGLPADLSSFIGREEDIARVRRILFPDLLGASGPGQQSGGARLVTLIGPAGIGKTRLALRVAADLQSAFEGGALFIPLAEIRDPALLFPTIARALGLRASARRTARDVVRGFLCNRQMLLMLDNLEQVLAAGPLIAELLAAHPRVAVIATSREALHLPGEQEYPVPPLALPQPNRQLPAETLGRFAAIALFVARAQAVRPGFVLTEANAPAVARICRALDGLPLAIELVAAQARVLSPEQIAARLDENLALLSIAHGAVDARHRTLQAALDWSYELLDAMDRLFFRRVTVFADGFNLDAAMEVCADAQIPRDGVFDLVAHLVSKSLVVAEGVRDETRYFLLATIRRYALAKLVESGEADSLRARHMDFFLRLAERVEPELTGPDQAAWLEQLATENANLRAALAWCAERAEVEAGLRLAGALGWFWFLRGDIGEEGKQLEELLAQGQRTSPKVRAKALLMAALMAVSRGEHARASALNEESLQLYRRLEDQEGIAFGLCLGGSIAHFRGDNDVASGSLEESLRLFRELGHPFGTGVALLWLADTCRQQGQYRRAAAFWDESLALFRKSGNQWGIAFSLGGLGDIAKREGNYGRATALLREGLAVHRRGANLLDIPHALEGLAVLAVMQAGDAPSQPHAGLLYRAAQLFGAASALREAIQAPAPPSVQSDYTPYIARLRATLDAGSGILPAAAGRAKARPAEASPGLSAGASPFETAWAEGRAMTWEQAVEEALADDEDSSAEPVVHPADRATVAGARVAGQGILSLRIRALGPGQVDRGDHSLTSSDWTYAKARELFFYLLCHPPRTKEQIGLALWPDASARQLRDSFRVTLYHLRQAVGGPSWVLYRDGHYTFNRALPYWCDAEMYESHLASARKALSEDVQGMPDAAHHFAEATALYAGDFLEDLDADWVVQRREELLRMHLEALLAHGELMLTLSRHDRAAEIYLRAIAKDSYLEAAHRGLMRCYARQGELSQALRHYRALVALLREELHSAPAPETTALYESLRRGEEGPQSL